ncbi:MAG: hypothetical protein JJ848_000340 [Prochlorococcus marinus CUG1439]|uniref:hypothetical protein n=1 Tax=Prochlorococcus sp. MIT 1314 TaxID=3096220 RepID=UPI001B118A2C|nr:hypothetical protein [Prochlorococcus sp. MIT 1314]MCR8538789.1 hypothetical protein [Prochlorococcus marinus CUG1439]
MKLIVFELNEIPKRILDDFEIKKKVFKKFRKKAYNFKTFVEDDPILSPWTTWPTVHLGQKQRIHQIEDLGQEIDQNNSKYKPIWAELKEEKFEVGVYGSLHSSNIPKDIQEYSFYIGDCFGNNPIANPKQAIDFNRFQQSIIKKNSREIQKKLGSFELNGVRALKKLGVLGISSLSILKQLLSEIINRDRVSRRRDLMVEINYFIFRKLLKNCKPHFSTFFANNVAASMHRYWEASYPEDYKKNIQDPEWIKKYKNEIWHSMDISWMIIKDLIKFINKNNDFRLLIVSSMGQEAIEGYKISEKQWQTNSIVESLHKLGIVENKDKIEERTSMFPIYSIKAEKSLIRIIWGNIQKVSYSKELKFRTRLHKNECSISFEIASAEEEPFLNFRGKKFLLKDIGFNQIDVKETKGTSAYHQPEGIGIYYGFKNTKEINALGFQKILKTHNLKKIMKNIIYTNN